MQDVLADLNWAPQAGPPLTWLQAQDVFCNSALLELFLGSYWTSALPANKIDLLFQLFFPSVRTQREQRVSLPLNIHHWAIYIWPFKFITKIKFKSLGPTSHIFYVLIANHIGKGEGNGTPLQYSCLENPMDRGAWWATVHGVAESWTLLSNFTFTFHFHALEKEMATHSSVLAWRIPGMAEPGGVLFMGSHRVGHD